MEANKVLKLEDANGGNYRALFGEIVGLDCYGLRRLPFVPNTILDFGANCGIFTRYCRELWPESNIISVEPDAENFAYLEAFSKHPKTILINKAVGNGNIYRIPNALNGAHECYLSEGIGYSESELKAMQATKVGSIMLTQLLDSIHGKVLLKVDIEGNDTVVMNDPDSVELIKTFDYVAFEIHNYAQTHEKVIEVKKIVADFIESLSETHKVTREHSYLFATLKTK
jgi:FkbM family methyltransferase